MKLLTLLAIAIFSTSAYAGAPAETTDLNSKWTAAEANGDGLISKEEAATDADISDNWDTIDANQDGNVDSQEFVGFFSKN